VSQPLLILILQSCDTFLKIVTKCKGKFAVVQEGDTEPFTYTVIKAIPSIISDLNAAQVLAVCFYF
jgi:exportin-1